MAEDKAWTQAKHMREVKCEKRTYPTRPARLQLLNSIDVEVEDWHAKVNIAFFEITALADCPLAAACKRLVQLKVGKVVFGSRDVVGQLTGVREMVGADAHFVSI